MADLQAGGSALSDTDRSDIRTGLGLGNSATRNVGTTAGTVAAGDDSRLSDSRAPTTHSHPATAISDSSTVGRQVLTAADAAAARTAIGAASASGAGIFGPYADTTALQAAKPAAANPGSMAYVGASAPYAQYVSTGSAWVLVGGSGGAYEVADWPALLALSGVPDGREYHVLAPVCTGGVPGTKWKRAASLTPTGWIIGGGQTLAMLTTQVDGASSTTTEQTLWEPQFEAGVLASIQSIRVRSRFIFSAADTNTRTMRLRLRDTSSGDVIVGQGTTSASNRWFGLGVFVNPVSATQNRPWAATATTISTSPDASAGASTVAADLTIPSLADTAIYVGLTVQQGATPLGIASLSLAQIYGE